MTLNFIHFEHPRSDTYICFDKIAYVQRLEDVVFIHFDGDSKPVQLRGEAAGTFLQVVQDNSLTIYVNDSESESKNANHSISKFIQIGKDMVLNVEAVSLAQRIEGNVLQLFQIGDSTPLHLEGKEAQAVWTYLTTAAPNICPHSEQPRNS